MHQLTLSEAPQSYPQPTSSPALMIQEANGSYRIASEKEVLAVARELIEKQITPGTRLNGPETVKDFFRLRLNHSMEHEVFAIAFLSTRFDLIEYAEPFRGTLTQTPVYPREVVKMALKANAAAVIIAHNHPSGDSQPSDADIAFTKTLTKALALIDVRVLDHIIVAGNKTYSFAEKGHL